MGKLRTLLFDKLGDWMAENRQLLLIIGVLLLAALFRFWQLDSLPPGLHPDEASIGLTSIAITEGEVDPVYTQDHPRSGPFIYLTSLSVSIFGNTAWALRLVPALIGVVAVLLTYLAARSWFSQRVALIAALFMATSPWLVHINRTLEPSNFLLLLVPLAMWSFAKAIKTNSAKWYVLTGITLGGLFYTDSAIYILPLIALVATFYARKFYREELKRMLQPLLIVILSAALTVLPFAIYFAANYQEFMPADGPPGRIEPADAVDAAPVWLESAVRNVALFHFQGDENPLHSLPGEPLLNGLVGLLLILGLVLAARRIKDVRYFALLAILTIWLISGSLSLEEEPSALVLIGAAPAVFILAAIGLTEMVARWRGVFPRNDMARHFAAVVILVALFSGGWYDWQRYFTATANSPETFETYHEQSFVAGNYLKNLDGIERAVLVTEDRLLPPVQFLATGHTDFEVVEPASSHGIVLSEGELIVVPRIGAGREVSLPDYEREDVFSGQRPTTIMFTVYTP